METQDCTTPIEPIVLKPGQVEMIPSDLNIHIEDPNYTLSYLRGFLSTQHKKR